MLFQILPILTYQLTYGRFGHFLSLLLQRAGCLLNFDGFLFPLAAHTGPVLSPESFDLRILEPQFSLQASLTIIKNNWQGADFPCENSTMLVKYQFDFFTCAIPHP